MAETMISAAEGAFADRSEAKHRVQSTPGYQAYRILHAGFVAAPLLAGLDKFFHLLTNWDIYLAPRIAALSPIGGHGLMSVVGVVEVCVGVVERCAGVAGCATAAPGSLRRNGMAARDHPESVADSGLL
jgi:hypothetical protein